MIKDIGCEGCNLLTVNNKYSCGMKRYVEKWKAECPCISCLVKVMCKEHCDLRMTFVSDEFNSRRRMKRILPNTNEIGQTIGKVKLKGE